VFVKICGITRGEDAQAAVDLGAAAIGFVFWPGSPRFIDPFRARVIAAALPPFVTAVGVFVNQSVEEVNGVSSLVPLGAVQLHGDEPPSFAAHVRRPVVKALFQFDAAEVAAWPSRITLLADAHDPVRRGGTGVKADWSAAAALARSRRVILAGGLGPDNVADAIEAVRPFGIDVSSGVEVRPGIKDRAKMEALFGALARVHAGETVQ
jgi:phosphoribosylanthranilate isomerase